MPLLYMVFIFVITQKGAFGANTNESSYELPCKKSDLNFNECINENINIVYRRLGEENRNLGVMRLDPLSIEAIRIEHTLGSLDIDQQFAHIKITGFSNSIISNARMDVDNCQLYFESLTPSLIAETVFRIGGHFYLVPIAGEGPATVTIKNLKATHNITCTRYKKKGIEYIRVTSYDVDLQAENVKYKFENILDENSQLNDEVHNLFTSNSLSVFKQGLPSLKHAFEVVGMGIVNKVLPKIPLNTVIQE